MKKVMLTALTATLLAGTSAYAGAGGALGSVQAQNQNQNGGFVGRTVQEAQRRSEDRPQREEARPQRQQEARPQQPQEARPQRQDAAPAAGPQAPRGDRPDRQGPRQGEGQRQGGRQGQGDRQAERPAPPAAVAPPQRQAQPQRQAPPQAQQRQQQQGGFVGRTVEDAQRRAQAQGRDGRGGDWNNGRGGNRPDWNDGRGSGGRDGNWNNGGNGRGPDWDRDRRDRDRSRPRYDQRYWPQFVQPRERYRWYGQTWIPQPGFYSRNWGYGDVLPWSWYTPRYYLNDYYRYSLPMPPIGYEWVRVGRDALLVDVFTGRVHQVVRLLFW